MQFNEESRELLINSMKDEKDAEIEELILECDEKINGVEKEKEELEAAIKEIKENYSLAMIEKKETDTVLYTPFFVLTSQNRLTSVKLNY